MPKYETKADLSREVDIANRVAEKHNLIARKLPADHRYSMDYGFYREDETIAFVAEIKCRTTQMEKYPTLFLSLHKVRELLHIDQMGIRAILIVCWTDITGYAVIDERIKKYEIKFGGRYDREDSEDVEPVMHFPLSAFYKFSWST